MLFRHIDEPGLASIETYRRLGGYRSLERAVVQLVDRGHRRDVAGTEALEALDEDFAVG